MPTPNQHAEQVARDKIDAQLRASGWAAKDKTSFNPNDGEGRVIREYTTDTGPADYVLFVDRKAVAMLSAIRSFIVVIWSAVPSERQRRMSAS